MFLTHHFFFFFFFNDTATTEIYTLSLHDALPIDIGGVSAPVRARCAAAAHRRWRDRKSTRLNSSHVRISYAVFCLKKKNITERNHLVKIKKKNEKKLTLISKKE